MTFSLFGGGALETELNLTMKSAVVGVIITSVTDGWDGGSKKKKNPQKMYRYTIVELQKTFSQNVYCIKCYFRPMTMMAKGVKTKWVNISLHTVLPSPINRLCIIKQ